MALNNQIISSLAANLVANAAGGITGANIANVTSNLQTFISNNGTAVKSIGIQSSTDAGFTANYTLTLPPNVGTSSQVLSTDGTGILSWTTVSGGGSGASISNGNSNVNIPSSNGNVNISAVGNANILVVTGTGANITGTLNVSANANVGNLGTATAIITTGNITTINSGLLQNGNSNVAITANANITLTAKSNATMVISDTGANITGTANISGNANVGNLGTAALIATSNIDFTTSPNVSLGSNANVKITGGSASQYLQTDGTGNLSWQTVSGGGGASISNGNSNVNIPAANGNVNISAVGNANVLVITGTGANITGTLDVTANANVGNIGTATAIITTGNITTINTGLVQNGNSNIAITSNANITLTAKSNATMVISDTGANITGTANVTSDLSTGGNLTVSGTGVTSIAGNINMNGKWVGNIGYAVADTDAASKLYVDTLVSTGISYHESVNAATTTTLATSTSGTTAYNQPNGAGNGIGAYISTTGTFTTIDGVTINGSTSVRILVKDEANATWNGVYTYTNATAITRSTDADQAGVGNTQRMGINDYFFTQAGTTNGGTSFIVSAPAGTITFGTSNIEFSIFSTSQVYTGGTGITVTGTVISANANQSQVTTVGTLGNLSVTGNTTSGNFIGIFANGNSNISIPSANGNVNISAVGNANIFVVTGTGANITGTANVSGNANVGNLGTAALIATGNVNFTTSPNVSLGAVGNLKITGGTADYVLQTDGTGNLSWVAQAGGGGGGASIANGNSNVNIATANGNVTISAVGNANILVVTGTGANVTGTANVTGNVIGGNIVTTGQITSTQAGNASTGGGQLYLNGSGNVRIDFSASGLNPPAFTTRSSGQKITLYPALTGSEVDYAIGVAAGAFWSSIDQASSSFDWFAGTTEIANLTGTGAFQTAGNITAPNFLGNLVGDFANGNSNISINANGNINMSIGGNVNKFVIDSSGNLYVAQYITGAGGIVLGSGNTNIRWNVNNQINFQAIGTNVMILTNTSIAPNANVIPQSSNNFTLGNSANFFSSAFISNLTSSFVDSTNPVGFRNVPIVSVDANVANTVAADAGKAFLHALATPVNTVNIAANANVSYILGTVLTFINSSANALTISCGDSLILIGNGASGTRTLAQYGMATAIKTANTVWVITGTNIT